MTISNDFTKIERSLFEYLKDNSDTVVSRDTLLRNVWNKQFEPNTNLVQVAICRLRQKLPTNSYEISNYYGEGYKLIEKKDN